MLICTDAIFCTSLYEDKLEIKEEEFVDLQNSFDISDTKTITKKERNEEEETAYDASKKI